MESKVNQFLNQSLEMLNLETIFIDNKDQVSFPRLTFFNVDKIEKTSLYDFILKYFPSYIHEEIMKVFESCKSIDFSQKVHKTNIFDDLKTKVISHESKKFFLEFKALENQGMFVYFIPVSLIKNDYSMLNLSKSIVVDNDGDITFVSSKLEDFKSIKTGVKFYDAMTKFNQTEDIVIPIKQDKVKNISTLVDGICQHNNPSWESIKNGDIYVLSNSKKKKILMKAKVNFIKTDKKGQIQIIQNEDQSTQIHQMVITFSKYKNYQREEIVTESRQILDLIDISYVILDKKGKIKWFNKSFSKNITSNDNFIHSKYLTQWLKTGGYSKLINVLKENKKSFYLYSLDHKKTYKAEINQFLNQGDDNIDYLISIIDITDFIEKESKILKCQEMQAIGNLTTKISHDFNNLLTVINILCKTLLTNEKDDELGILIQDSINRASKLVKQILSFAKNGNTKNTPVKISLADMISGLSNLLDKITGAKVVFQYNINTVESNVFFDTGELEQVVINLVVNARDAIDVIKNPSGLVEVNIGEYEVDRDLIFCNKPIPYGVYKSLSIKDNGSGIPHSIVNQIFNPFFSTKKNQGTGLGLSTVLDILRRNNSYILINTEVNKGTEFIILIQSYRGQITEVIKREIESEVDSKEIELKKKQSQIILLDDDKAIRMLIQKSLEIHNYNIKHFSTASDAIKYIELNKVDVIISDVEMPDMDGPEFVKKAMVIKPNLKAIFISGYKKESIDIDLKHKNISFLPKPFDSEDLVKHLNKVI